MVIVWWRAGKETTERTGMMIFSRGIAFSEVTRYALDLTLGTQGLKYLAQLLKGDISEEGS
jgi:hypothetical protein